jgi:hypothetical protein
LNILLHIKSYEELWSPIKNDPKGIFISLTKAPIQLKKSANFWLSKSIFYVKNYPNLSNFFSLKNIIIVADFLLLILFGNLIFEARYFIELCPFFVSWSRNFGKRYENALRVIFDRWPKFSIGFDVQCEIQILKVI